MNASGGRTDGDSVRSVLGIAGSLRSGSFNRGLLKAAAEVAPAGLQVARFDRVAEIPLYNLDVEREGDPAAVRALKEAIEAADGLLLACPEYNHGPSGVMKNLVDWASRPPRDPPVGGKPAAIMGASPGRFGTVRAQAVLREVLRACGARVMPSPNLLVGGAHDLFDDSGRLVDDSTRERLKDFLEAFAGWIERFEPAG